LCFTKLFGKNKKRPPQRYRDTGKGKAVWTRQSA
jgi:hypothetical protein